MAAPPGTQAFLVPELTEVGRAHLLGCPAGAPWLPGSLAACVVHMVTPAWGVTRVSPGLSLEGRAQGRQQVLGDSGGPHSTSGRPSGLGVCSTGSGHRAPAIADGHLQYPHSTDEKPWSQRDRRDLLEPQQMRAPRPLLRHSEPPIPTHSQGSSCRMSRGTQMAGQAEHRG